MPNKTTPNSTAPGPMCIFPAKGRVCVKGFGFANKDFDKPLDLVELPDSLQSLTLGGLEQGPALDL